MGHHSSLIPRYMHSCVGVELYALSQNIVSINTIQLCTARCIKYIVFDTISLWEYNYLQMIISRSPQ